MARKLRDESPPPSSYINGILFLDDLEEIIRVFEQAERKRVQAWGDDAPADYRATLTITVDRWECDSVEDLRNLGHYDNSVAVQLVATHGGGTYHFYLAGGGFAYYVVGADSQEEQWAIYGQISEIINRRKLPWWHLRRRSRIIFQRSFEYEGLPATLKRHGWQIVIVVVTSLVTLAASEGVKALWRHFHPAK